MDQYIDMSDIHTVFGLEVLDDYREVTNAHLDELVKMSTDGFRRWDTYSDSVVAFKEVYGFDAADNLVDRANNLVAQEMLDQAESEYYDKGGSLEGWGECYVSDTKGITVKMRNDDGRYTRAFRFVVWLYTCLRECPYLDEDKFSELESEAQEEVIAEELNWIASNSDDENIDDIIDYMRSGDVSDELRDDFDHVAYEYMHELYVDSNKLEKIVNKARDEFYAKRATEQMTV